MTDFTTDASNTDADAKRLAIEIVATLVNIKKIAAQQLLTPAGVPPDLIETFLTGRNPVTGQRLSKREAAAIILDGLATTPGKDREVVRRLITLAAGWTNFHLAMDEYAARGVAQKARDMQGVLAEFEARELAAHQARMREASQRKMREQAEAIAQHSPLLLAMFDAAVTSAAPQERGYLLQDLFNRLFDLHALAVRKSFQRNEGAEQIDGAFEMEGWHYIVECRWRSRAANVRELDGLLGQIGRSGHQTMGLFLSINGWSENVAAALKQNAEKRIFMMDGLDLRTVLAEQIDLRTLLKAKLKHLNLNGEPYLPVSSIIG